MIACQKIEKIISRYVVGALPPWSRVAVARHLDACSPCRRLAESHHRVALLLDRLPGDDPPSGLWNGVFNEIGREAPGAARIPANSWDWRPGVVVAAAGLAAGVLLGQTFNGSLSPPESMPVINQSSASAATFVQQHGRLSLQDPLADPVSLGAYVTTAFRDNERLEGGANSR